MRIKKMYQGKLPENKILNNNNSSSIDTYSCDYINTAINNAVRSTLSTALSNALNAIFPVGSIYMSVNSTDPGTLFGGKWERISQGRFIMGVGKNEANSTNYWGEYPANSTNMSSEEKGGAYSHVHSTGNCTLTTNQIPSHRHDRGTYNITGSFITRPMANDSNIADARGTNAFYYTKDAGGENWYTALSHQGTSSVGLPTDLITFDASKTWSGSSGYKGGGEAHNHGNTGWSNHLPPYFAVYVWKRVA